mgnify:CR=1 FL=1
MTRSLSLNRITSTTGTGGIFEGELVPVKLDYLSQDKNAGVNLAALEESFKQGVKLFLYSNPNNPTGVIFSEEETREIARLAKNTT